MEACSGSHHVGRRLVALGHDARLIPAPSTGKACIRVPEQRVWALASLATNAASDFGLVDGIQHPHSQTQTAHLTERLLFAKNKPR